MDQPTDPADLTGEDPTFPTDEGMAPLIGEVKRLASDARTLAEAELAYQTSRAKVAASSAGTIAAWGVAALLLVSLALFALVMGLLLSLAAMVGPLAATGIMFLLLLGAALGCALAAKARVRRMTDMVFPKEGA